MSRARSSVLPMRRPRNPWPKHKGWPRVEGYAAPARRANRGWIAAMVALPLAAFTVVFAWDGPRPATAVPAAVVAVTGEAPRPRGWDSDPAALDAAQPDVAALAPARARFARGQDREGARFGLCRGRGRAGGDCVVDGDTFWYAGEKIRIADINTPETGTPRCAREAALGAAATARLLALLNQGAFSLEPADRDRDKYGRALRVVTRGGASLGGVLVREGLAEEWRGYRRDWC